MPSLTGSEALVKSLEAEGVDTVFALPGVQVMNVFDAIHANPNICLIAVRHEQATTYAADGYARVTGKPGVALVVPGPGAMNAASGLGTAYTSSSPVLLISGQIASGTLGKNQGQLHRFEDSEIGTEFLNPDWSKLGDAYGVPAIPADSPANLTKALERAVRMDSPVLIHVDFPLIAPPFQVITS